ncbi:hypothetical protein TrCOL_g7481 [Triparma columacea]|uniref:Uncharacterized protein n=1 Tax=Triparma columacea TaxID=722753 RepID=A0A9W7G4J8_9STRA|nr:hypothetical protein TrCOL_g7481 [Triparma columacea]
MGTKDTGFVTSFKRQSDRKESCFGEPPELKTRTGRLGKKTHLTNLISIVRESEGGRPKKGGQGRNTRGCKVCGRIFGSKMEVEGHERACRMLMKGEMRSKASKNSGTGGLAGLHAGSSSNRLDELLARTAAYGQGLGVGGQGVGGSGDPGVGPCVGDFFSTHKPAQSSRTPFPFNSSAGISPGDFATGPQNTNDYISMLQREKKEERRRERERMEKEKERLQRKREMAREDKLPVGFSFPLYNRKWEAFLRVRRLESAEDIPWLPAALTVGNLGVNLAEARSIVRGMILRWHPDKFSGVLQGKEVGEGIDLVAVMERVKGTSMMLIGLMKDIKEKEEKEGR